MALAAVCFFWGTTYLGIRIALESFPPLFLVAMRFTISGLITLIAARFVGSPLPRGSELIRTMGNGVLILGVGNTCLSVAEQWIPSGLAALFVTISPFWMVGIEAAIPGGAALHGPTILGMLLGLAGVGALVAPAGWGGMHGSILAGFLVLQLGGISWSAGSILHRRIPSGTHPIVSGGVQQLASGLVLAIPALLLARSHPPVWNTRGLLAVAYLITFGSLVGYSAFIYAMSKLPVAIVSIYNYVNPVVAVFLGWLFYREAFGWREAIAMAIIFAGVAVVKRYGHSPPSKGPAQQASADEPAEHG